MVLTSAGGQEEEREWKLYGLSTLLGEGVPANPSGAGIAISSVSQIIRIVPRLPRCTHPSFLRFCLGSQVLQRRFSCLFEDPEVL